MSFSEILAVVILGNVRKSSRNFPVNFGNFWNGFGNCQFLIVKVTYTAQNISATAARYLFTSQDLYSWL